MKNREEIRELFYRCIVPEAAKGKVDVFFLYSVLFNTKIVEINRICKNKDINSELMVPTLMIKDMDDFDDLLYEYVLKAMKYYDDNNFHDEILNDKMYDKDKMICKEKAIITHMFANMTYEDFNNPIEFLKRRIDFFDNAYEEICNLGYSDMLDANMKVEITNDTINNETPSQFIVTCYNDDGDSFVFPKVKFGISGDTVYFYAIQNDIQDKNSFTKQINRKLYKVGEGVSSNDELKDVTASFLVALNMAISYFNSKGYTKYVVPSIMPVRWNSKQIIINNKFEKGKIDFDKKEELEAYQEMIQDNLTNKLIRTFLRLGVHYNNIDVLSFPQEVDSMLHICINDTNMVCNNKLLNETYLLVQNNGNIKKK